MFCFSLDFGTVLTENLMKNKTSQSEQFQNLMKNKTSHTVRTDPKSNEKQNMPHSENSSKI
jgi:hypothetical protein